MSLKEIITDLRSKFPSGKIESYGPMIWFQFSNDVDTLNFEISDWTTIDVGSEKTGISYKKELLDIIKKMDSTTPQYQVPGHAIETLISDLFDSAGFNEIELVDAPEKAPKMDAFYTEMRKLIPNPNREIQITSFNGTKQKFSGTSFQVRQNI